MGPVQNIRRASLTLSSVMRGNTDCELHPGSAEFRMCVCVGPLIAHLRFLSIWDPLPLSTTIDYTLYHRHITFRTFSVVAYLHR